MTRWTQEESVAFESARECITHLMAVCSAQIASGRLTAAQVEEARVRRSSLAAGRASFKVTDHDEVRRIRAEYGRECAEARLSGGGDQGQEGSRSPE